MFSYFLPKDKKFFSQFNSLSKKIEQGALALGALLNTFDKLEERAREIKRIEHECDSITHETLNHLNTAFVTPFDHADIYSFVSQLDDIMDFIESTANNIELFNMTALNKDIESMGKILCDATTALSQAVCELDNLKKKQQILSFCLRIDSLENEADRIYRRAVANLFADKDKNKIHTIDVLKWKEIYDSLESSIDACKTVANTIESIILKSS